MLQRRCDRSLELGPAHDQIEHAVLEQEFAALESLGQLLANRLLDDAWTGEADEGARLGDVEIAEHGEGSRHATGRGIRQDRDVRQACL